MTVRGLEDELFGAHLHRRALRHQGRGGGRQARRVALVAHEHDDLIVAGDLGDAVGAAAPETMAP